MKANFLALGLFGLASASAILPRDDYKPDEYKPEPYKSDSYKSESYKPKPEPYKPKPYKSEPEPYKQDGYKPEPYKQDGYKPEPYKQDGYKPEPYKQDGYKQDGYKQDGYKPKPKYDDYATSPDYADEDDYETGYDYKNPKGGESSWKPKSKSPEFFNLRVDEKCNVVDGVVEPPAACAFNGYAIRLEGGIFIATPYNKWWDPKLPTFFVDDDTQLYTVSKDPLQVYIDGITGALKYTKIGWLPPNAIAISFYHTGNNPLGLVDPSPSYLSWPSTQGGSFFGSPWVLCPLGSTQQYQVFINSENFGIGGPAGVAKDPGSCVSRNLAAVNANPWKQESSPAPYYPQPYSG